MDYNEVHKQIYDDAYALFEEAKQKAYERGMEDAWEAARKLELDSEGGGLDPGEAYDIFGTCYPDEIIKNNSAKEAKEKIDNYLNEHNSFRVGDEVIDELTKDKYVFVGFEHTGLIKKKDVQLVRVIGSDGVSWIAHSDRFKKTGRHFNEVDELMRKLKSRED